MRVVLEIREGVATGKKIWILSGQTISVGRSEASDFMIAGDGQLSGHHFQVQCLSDTCQLKDLNSTNGTLVNGQRVREQLLGDGDEIVAGQSRFTVSILSDVADARLATQPLPAPDVDLPPAVAMANAPATVDREPVALGSQLPVLVLDVEAKRIAHRRIWLRPERPVSFGRSRKADEAFPYDQRMSSRHFVLEPAELGWQCRDLGSTNGTFVNDVRIEEATLHAGDRIAAGVTTFAVTLGGESLAAPAAGIAGASRRTMQQIVQPPRASELAYRRFDCRSGLAAYLGQKPGFDPMAVARLLCAKRSPVVIANRESVAASCPSASIESLCGGRQRAGESVRVVTNALDPEVGIALLAAVWGRDDAVIAIPGAEEGAVVESLVAFSQAAADRGAAPQLVGMHPVALAEYLANSAPADVEGLFAVLSAILVEAYQGDRWLILALPTIEAELARSGFCAVPSWA